MTQHDLLLNRATLPGGALASLGIADGRIVAIDTEVTSGGDAREISDLAGALVLPGLVDGHVHLDKTFLGDAWHAHRPDDDIAHRIAIEKEHLSDAAPIEQRASALVRLAISRGTTHLRTHVDIDPEIGLRHLDSILAVRERYRDAIGMQIVAFPQSGVLAAPGTLDLLAEALSRGADIVGGLDPAGIDGDIDGQLDAVFALAERHGAGIDIHLHDAGLLGLVQIEAIAARTKALDMGGHVAISHAYALGMAPDDHVDRVAAQLADAGVSIMTNAPGNHPFPPVLRLRAAGVTVFAGSDNIRDSWWPYGDADMLERAMLIGYRSGFFTDEELGVACDLATHAAACALGIEDYGLHVGARADLVVVEARHIPEAVVARPPRRYVMKAGRIVARDVMTLPDLVSEASPM